MRDIERELRALGERTAIPGDRRLRATSVRRIRRRRLSFIVVGSMTALALIAGSTYALTSALRSEPIAPAIEYATVLIEYEQSGGYAGETHSLTVMDDGTSILRVERNASSNRVEFDLSGDDFAKLKDEVAVIDWPTVDGPHVLPGGVVVMDGVALSLRHDAYVVEIEDSSVVPRALDDLLAMLENILESAPSPDSIRCGLPVDFEAGYVPEGWSRELQQGEGGDGEFPAVIGHFGNDAEPGTTSKASGGFIDLLGERFYSLSNKEQIRVLDRSATLGDIHEGYSVEFFHGGCEYYLIAFGIERAELKKFAEGLRIPGTGPEDDQAAPEYFGAVWPEDTYEQSRDTCVQAAAIEPWRENAAETAEEFGARVLGWGNATASLASRDETWSLTFELRKLDAVEVSMPRGPSVFVHLIEVFRDCWVVTSVQRSTEESERYSEDQGASLGVQGRKVQMYFADQEDSATAVLEVGYGGRATRYVWSKGEAFAEFTLDFEPLGTGHFLILLRDENGEVFSAFGSSLPEGDFAAG